MKNKYLFVGVLLAVLLLAGMGLTEVYVSHEEDVAEESLEVVTSFYPMYIAALNVVGDTPGVQLHNLSEPQTGCLHDYQLTPADMKLLSQADVFIVNGGGIEAFLSDVAKQYPDLIIIEAGKDIDLLEETTGHDEHEKHDEHEEHADEAHEADEHEHEHGDENAHAWMSVTDYMMQVQTIADGLSEADPQHADRYVKNAKDYQEQLTKLKDELTVIADSAAGSHVVILHEAYAYVADELGLEVSYVLNLDEERQVSAGEVADVLEEIRENDIQVVLAEETYGADMGETIERESEAKVYYLDTLVRGTYDADSYLDAMQENIKILKEAFAK